MMTSPAIALALSIGFAVSSPRSTPAWNEFLHVPDRDLQLCASQDLAGILDCNFVVTIPLGVASFRMALFALSPFGKTVVQPARGTGGREPANAGIELKDLSFSYVPDTPVLSGIELLGVSTSIYEVFL